MLSKSKGQVLHVAAVMHVLSHMATPDDIPRDISEAAVRAADTFVDYCLQHAAYLGGEASSKRQWKRYIMVCYTCLNHLLKFLLYSPFIIEIILS